MSFAKRVVFWVSLCFVFSACSITFPHATPLQNIESTISNQRFDTLCGRDIVAQKGTIHLQWEFVRDAKNFRAVPFWYYDYANDTNSRKNDLVLGEVFLQKHPLDHGRFVILIPGTGEDISTVGTAELLARHGFDVIRFRSGIDILDKNEIAKIEILSPSDLRTLSQKGAGVIKTRLCDYVAIINYFDLHYRYKYIGVSGVSLGGIFASLIAYENPKVRAALLMITGGNIAEILRTSTEGGIVKLREMLLERFDGTTEEFWRILSDELKDIDPTNRTRYIGGDRVHIIANYWDTVIRYQYSKQLKEVCAHPKFETILFPPGHYGSVLLLWVPTVRWEARLIGPVPYIWPTSVDTVKNINLKFFTKTLPIH